MTSITHDQIRFLIDVPTAVASDVQRVVGLAKRLGLRMVLTKSVDSLQAEARRFQVTSGNDPNEVVSDACHEIAHYLCAPDDLKDYPNYGLGPSPDDSHVVDPLRVVDKVEAFAMEAQASILGLCIERSLGVSALGTFLVHSWIPYPSERTGQGIVVPCPLQRDVVVNKGELESIELNLRLLQNRGLIDANLHPIYPDTP